MKSIIKYFIKYPIAGNALLAVTFIFGWFSLTSLRSAFFPESESTIINIRVTYPGSSPEEIEEGVVLKIEDNLKGLTGIKEISSVSQENAGSVTVEIEDAFDIDLILQDVKNAVDQISSFPDGMEPPSVYKQENLNIACTFTLSGDADLRTLKAYGRQVENDLRGIPGISKVELAGFPDEEIEISLREDDLRSYQLTFDQVTQAVRSANLEITGGTIKGEREELQIRSRSKEYYADNLKDIIVKASDDGTIIRLKDVADVEDKWADTPNRSYMNGNTAVTVIVNYTIEEDIIYISDRVNEYIEEFNQKNNYITATMIRDGAVVVNQRIDLLVENGIVGSFLVLVFLALFLKFRLAFWVALGIPVSFFGMFILASLYGISINISSLFGMIIVVGILVDDGIVISENIYQHYEKGKPPIKAAIDGTMEVVPAVFSAIITTVLAFSIFFFLEGRIGDFANNIAFVVIVTLSFSLIEGFFILPGHVAHSNSLKRGEKDGVVERKMANFMDWMKNKLYAPVLRFCINNHTMGLAIPLSFLILSLAAVAGGIVKTTFFAPLEFDVISIELTMPSGTSSAVTSEWLDKIEKAVFEVNDEFSEGREDSLEIIKFVDKRVGPSINTGSINISLLDAETRNVPSYLITNAIRERTGPIPEADKVSYGTRSIFGKPVSISLLGNNLEELNAAKEELKLALSDMPELKDVVDSDQEGLREIDIKLKEKAHLLGLTLQQVVNQVRYGFFGSEVQRLQRGLDEVKVWVRYKETDRRSVGNLEDMRIRTDSGQEFPLREIAFFEVQRGLIAINHLNGKREINVEADLADPNTSATDMMSIVSNQILPPVLSKYPTVAFEYGGQTKAASRTASSGSKVVFVVLILIFVVISLTFRSAVQALNVIITVPFGVIGVVWGHFIHGAPISFLSAYGILALIGIMVNDSLVLVGAFNNLLKEGYAFKDALFEAGLSRFRPIVLTSVTTIAGLGPLILETSFQAKFLIPMAISVAYGLGVATFLTLLTLPVLLASMNALKVHLYWLWEGKKPTPEEMEPAVQELKAEIPQ
ncbi:efflux RND transporter permease subunit [Chondrinema litorale]|uniref:efflux RND transporter permease subunit n=1 Tax=Chondrinema litorale TaxID=2994555 RepID=UPI002542CCB4|nr:efflux RND transporter permease subunit [Chondrinema litorale]UZR93657.1 efflux RND transporter permease subunit [Chondrinema litorale]